MNGNHLRWCRLHDWGQGAKLENGKIMLDNMEFSTFSELYSWAGY